MIFREIVMKLSIYLWKTIIDTERNSVFNFYQIQRNLYHGGYKFPTTGIKKKDKVLKWMQCIYLASILPWIAAVCIYCWFYTIPFTCYDKSFLKKKSINDPLQWHYWTPLHIFCSIHSVSLDISIQSWWEYLFHLLHSVSLKTSHHWAVHSHSSVITCTLSNLYPVKAYGRIIAVLCQEKDLADASLQKSKHSPTHEWPRNSYWL